MKIYKYQNMSQKDKEKLFARSSVNYDAVKREIWPMMQQVKDLEDAAILQKYQQRSVPIQQLLVTNEEIKQAYSLVGPKFLQAFRIARKNLENVCLAQRKSLLEKSLVNNDGVKVWREWRAIESVGIYAPGGRANYPSTVLMCAVPALVAGCKEIVLCVPPNEQGFLPAEVVVTAAELGITNVFKVGGPQAISAMAFGTQSIPKVLKIVGPGNQYVNAAKLLVYPQTAIDLPAGPSENLIIADDSVNPKFVAIDLITDAEHGPDSTAILLTTSKTLATAVQREIRSLLKRLPTRESIEQSLQAYGAIILVELLEEAVQVSNEYAPEHLQIMTKSAGRLAKKISNAGSVFIGEWSAKAMGDYASGANHVLPTGQSAKMFGGLSVDSFGKWVEFQQASKQGFLKLSEAIETYGEVERLPAHKESSKVRRIKL